MIASAPDPENVGSEGILELYSLAVEMADRISARRATANTFFFTVQAGLAVSVGAFAVSATNPANPEPDRLLLFLAASAGLVIAGSWWLLLRSYRDLNRAKFEVILKIEREHLPIRMFDEEWKELKKDPIKKWRQRYAEQGQVESIVPIVFMVLYLILSVYVLVR